MRGQHGLSPLHVRVPRQDELTVPNRRLDERALQDCEADIDPVQRFTHPEFEISGDLVITASPGMQLATDISEFLDQGRLDVHVHIFALLSKRKAPIFDFSLYFRQRSHNLLALGVGEKSDSRKHVRMGCRTVDILLEKPTIEGDGLRELFDSTVSFAAETAAPGLTGHGSRSRVACLLVHKLVALTDSV